MGDGLTSKVALDKYFFQIRCKVLEVAADLDRVDRGEGAASMSGDPRLSLIAEAVGVLNSSGTDRAERIQNIFSLAYDPDWRTIRGWMRSGC